MGGHHRCAALIVFALLAMLCELCCSGSAAAIQFTHANNDSKIMKEQLGASVAGLRDSTGRHLLKLGVQPYIRPAKPARTTRRPSRRTLRPTTAVATAAPTAAAVVTSAPIGSSTGAPEEVAGQPILGRLMPGQTGCDVFNDPLSCVTAMPPPSPPLEPATETPQPPPVLRPGLSTRGSQSEFRAPPSKKALKNPTRKPTSQPTKKSVKKQTRKMVKPTKGKRSTLEVSWLPMR